MICTAVLLLTGCKNELPDVPSFVFPESSSESSYSSSTKSGFSSESAAVSTDTLQNESSVSSVETSAESDEPVNSDTPQTEISEPVSIGESSGVTESDAPVISETRTLSYDPINERTVEINGNTAIIRGKTADSPIDHMSLYPDGARYDLDCDENGFTAEIALTEPFDGYLNVHLRYEDNHFDEFPLKVSADGFEFWDLSEIAENNQNAAENAIDQPLNQVAEYIAEGGKPDEIRKVLEEIQALSDEICSGLDDDYDKLRAISRWVSANIYYDYPAYDRNVPPETLSLKYMLDNHSSVCGGYSNMTSALCAAQGIKCLNVHGASLNAGKTFIDSSDSEYHEWNFAEIDGRIIWIDSGWNSYCYLYRGGEYKNGGICYRYFDIGEDYFALNHKANYAEYRDYFAFLE